MMIVSRSANSRSTYRLVLILVMIRDPRGRRISIVASLCLPWPTPSRRATGLPAAKAPSVALVQSLLRFGLLDRLRLQVYPVALGTTGTKPVFEGLDRTTLELVASRVLDGQVVELDYQLKASAS